MQLVSGSERVVAVSNASPVVGHVRWAPAKSLWITAMSLAGIVIGPLTFSWDALALFFVTSAVTLCFGHSVGIHRRLIHSSFCCPRWLEHLCVYLGTLVGMAGPIGMIRVHDFRDWAQRQADCHDYFCHRKSFWHDAWWQLHCELVLDHPPRFQLEARLANDKFYAVVERTWMGQQLPWAVLFLAVGGLAWLVWGVCLRVSVCVIGHWLVGHFAHRQGGQTWIVQGAAAQGYNVRLAGLISMGESWHNNHHAFPGSAKLGLLPGEADPGWWLIKAFELLGLASDIRLPADLPARTALRRLPQATSRDPVLTGPRYHLP
ncbi:MAG: acyl-CoA desaturase [Alphaproteobacteria bacterium]|nr:acyl-CoA desaturase [Alphaproteobacteria bacterium]MBV8406289.1 acyl-CoA desaturase [Alphaproteobacteria bacterium]